MVRFRLSSVLLGASLILSSAAFGQPAPKDPDDERPCQFILEVSGAGVQPLPPMCPNNYGVGKDWVITAVSCWSTTGLVTILPTLPGMGPSSILPEPLTCGYGEFVGRTTPGTPTVHPFGANAANCPIKPCTVDVEVKVPRDSGLHQAEVVIAAIVKKVPKP